MHIGVPKELKPQEYRVGLTPQSVQTLVTLGHTVWIESQAGQGIAVEDTAYLAAGAQVVQTAAEVFHQSQLIVKVKELQPSEYPLLREDHILFAFLHLAPDVQQAQALIQSGCAAIAYETIQEATGRYPLLAPMSAIAGRLAVQVGAHHLERSQGGRGVLLGCVEGVPPGEVLVLGGGVVGSQAIEVAMGLGAHVTVLDVDSKQVSRLAQQWGKALTAQVITESNLSTMIVSADLVIGSILVPGACTPKIIQRSLLKKMLPKSVVVDVGIDQGGCVETARPTTHASPTYEEEGVIHYCVPNMPGVVPRTSTWALNHVVLPYVIQLADQGLAALKADSGFKLGLNVDRGQVTCAPVAAALKVAYVSADQALSLRGI